MYVWMGKNAALDRRRVALKLTQELWDNGYDYSECDVCPLNEAEYLGGREGITDVSCIHCRLQHECKMMPLS